MEVACPLLSYLSYLIDPALHLHQHQHSQSHLHSPSTATAQLLHFYPYFIDISLPIMF
jgi:hypothetical protein